MISIFFTFLGKLHKKDRCISYLLFLICVCIPDGVFNNLITIFANEEDAAEETTQERGL